ncbi:uncharacterized protein N7487_005831 [Penicillium crustosum]|uniref:uncharacterized protein n=1 Tax=Penicillium crustosum TaxID=36656 RepID=UPI002384A2F1|nr:uncharacterized protein N7487_005831 [Penicillium crustosum]KAJ5411472.1 hypothetical protein N7487_005831 [Penicillium crustosum]
MAFDATTDFVLILFNPSIPRSSSSVAPFAGRLEAVEQSLDNILRILQRLEGSKEQKESDAIATAERGHGIFEPKDTSPGNQVRSLTLADQNGSDPFLDILRFCQFPSSEQLLRYVEGFFDKVCPLYPIICDQVALAAASNIAEHGFSSHVMTCLVTLLVAIFKAHNSLGQDQGLREFQMANYMFSGLKKEFSLEFAQVEILSAIFLYRKGHVLEAWQHVHSGCTTLYVAIQRDILMEYNDLPLTCLSKLEHLLPLPLGCEESATLHMQPATRIIYTFFLAEISLKAILTRVYETPPNQLLQGEYSNYQLSPVANELEAQLAKWTQEIPEFLDWSIQPDEGTLTQIGTRVKLLYWLARFLLYRPLVQYVALNPEASLGIQSWVLFQSALDTGAHLVRVFLVEESETEPILYTRILSVVTDLEDAHSKGLLNSHGNMLAYAKAKAAELYHVPPKTHVSKASVGSQE